MTAATDHRLAIIGMSLRFPGAQTPEEYWRTVRDGRVHIRRFTERDFAAAGLPAQTYRDPAFAGASALLPGIERFDAEFFSISAREARITDPQHRMFLEVCHHALEHAGYAGVGPDTRVGVYASSGYHLYSLQNYLVKNVLTEPFQPEWLPNMQRDVGHYADFIATRVSFRLGLTGPAMGVQSACSSSLVAVHLARQALLTGDADIAVAGAAAIHLPQVVGYRQTTGSILSPTGRCLAFDAASDGTVGGNGVAAIVLKRLDRALADGDTIHAVLLGSGVNNDGATKRHYTEPGALGQQEAIRAALAAADVSPDTIGYVEAHGTGTYKGDPVEFQALNSVYREYTDRVGYCGIGSVKPNIGHLDVCSGLAGLIKAVLVLQEGVIPPLAGLTAPNPLLELDDSPFYLPDTPRDWPEQAGPRRAAVTSLGVGGTNAHAILEQAPERRPRRRATPPLPPPAMVPLSARNENALRDNARALRDRLRARPQPGLADLVTTLALGRRHLRQRLVVFGETPTELADALDSYLAVQDADPSGRPAARTRHVRGEVPRSRLKPAVWLFSGHGGIRPGMARALAERFRVVREVLDACEEQYRDEYGGSLLRVLLRADGVSRDQHLPTDVAQPALFALQAAQVRLWRELTDPPAAVAGHSVGEYAALHAAGALSLADGLRLTARRGALMRHNSPPGGMLAVFADDTTVDRLLAEVPGLDLAVVNGERHRVLSGPPEALRAAEEWLDEHRVDGRRLPVDRAFHSALVDPVLDDLGAACAEVDWRPTTVPFLSGADRCTVAAGWTPDAAYLVRQARRAVHFDRVLAEIEAGGYGVALELGPDQTLSRLLQRARPELPVLSTQRRGDDLTALWQAAARLYCRGSAVRWEHLLAGCGGGRVPLPGYQFQHRAYWTGPGPLDLDAVAEDHAEEVTAPSHTEQGGGERVEHVRNRVVELTAQQLGLTPDEVDPEVPFFDLGADSLQVIGMLRELEGEFGVKVAMRELFEHADTPLRLAELIAGQQRESGEAATTAASTPGEASPAPAAAQPRAAEQPTAAVGEPAALAADAPTAAGTTGPAADPVPSAPAKPEPAVPTGGTADAPAPAAASGFASEQAQSAPSTADRPEPGEDRRGVTAERHGPRVVVSHNSGMVTDKSSAATRRHLDDLIRRYTARTRRSKELAQKHRAVLADSRATVGFRSSTKEMLYPLAARRARGAHLEDIDGNRYTDITMGFGVLLFGHEPPFVTEAVQRYLADGIRLGPRGPETGEVAELISELTGAERVAFAATGTEANAAAIRLARAATGRNKIVVFRGAYHGHADTVLGHSLGTGSRRRTVPVSVGIPDSAVSELIVLEYGQDESLQVIEDRADEIAAVMVEPVQSRNPSLQPVEFVRRLRELTRRRGVVLFFDEMLTGFRPHPRGAQHLYGVQPDLATYGKLVGGGFPIGVIAGRSDILDGVDGGYWRYGDDSRPQVDTTFFGGTYLQHPVSMAAAHAVLTHLREQGPTLQERLNARTQALADSLNRFFTEEEFPLRVAHFGSMFRFEHRADMELLYHHLMLRGVYVWEWRNFFLSTAHDDEDVAAVEQAVVSSLRELREAGFFPGGGQSPRTTPRRPTPAPTPTSGARTGEPPEATPKASPEASPAAPAAAPAATAQAAAPTSASAAAPAPATGSRTPDLSLYFFGDYPESEQQGESYATLLEAARFADTHGFHGLWLPERHFHSFGGLFPNPSVLAAALAVRTDRVRLNAGSVVLPLHDTLRVVEEWAMVDNLSGGRVGLGCATGWNARDFVFFPERYQRRREAMYEQVAEVRRLWRGGSQRRQGGEGETEVRPYPRPVQAEPPMSVAIVSNPESYRQAARHDLGVVTNLMSQTPEQLAENIARYRRAREEAGLDPAAGRVVVLLHTYLHPDHDQARRAAYQPLARYMRSSLSLFGQMAGSLGHRVDPSALTEDDLDVLFKRAYERYCDQRALIGSPDSCLPVVGRLSEAGVDEIAALVDFGVPREELLDGLPHLDTLRRRLADEGVPAPAAPPAAARERIDAGAFEPAPAAPATGSTPAPAAADLPPARLSPGQQRIWFLERMLPEQGAYNEPVALRLEGRLDVAALRTALDRLVARHEALRTVFPAVDGEPRQVVRGTARAAFTEEDVTAEVAAGDPATRRTREEEVVRRVMAEETARRFDLANGPLFLTRLLTLAEDRYLLVLSFHHIVVDAVSAGVLARDLSALYTAVLEGRDPKLPELPTTYREFAERQHTDLTDDPETARDLEYWTKTLEGAPAALELPTDRPRPDPMTCRGGRLLRTLPGELAVGLRQVSRRSRATLFMGLLAGYAAMLHEASGATDIVIGTPVADRPQGTEDLVGFFVNTVALRFDLSGDPTFEELLQRVRSTALDAYDHARAPFESVVRAVAPPRDTTRTPVFQVMAEYESGEPLALSLPGVRASQAAVGAETSLLDLTIYFTARPDGVDCHLEYRTDLFDQATVESFFDRFQRILRAAVADPQLRLSQLPPGDVGQRRQVPDVLLDTLVADQARRHPKRPAVSGAGTELTYGELERRAQQVAARVRAALTDTGAPDADQVVAVWLPRTPDLVVALLGVLHAGAACLPLDPALGPQRVQTVLADSGARVLLTSGAAPELPPLPGGVTVLHVDRYDEASAAPQDDADLAARPRDPDDLAYVIYTSGSTGRPKGVAITHRNVVTLCQWFRRRFAYSPDDRVAAVCSQSFDAGMAEIWPALTGGASVVIADEDTRRDPAALARWFAQQRITVTVLPTVLGEAVLALPAAQQPPLRHLLLGGDTLRHRPRPDIPYRVWNIYGPSETTVLVTSHPATPAGPDGEDGPVPIGTPIDNVELYVLDEQRRPVPTGTTGELYVGGPQVTRGYLNLPGETDRRFIAHPFGGTGRLYRTGDLVRRRPDGALEFRGRTDDQVKIRGYRVEPGEAQHALCTLPQVADALVLARRDEQGEAHLAGYVVPADGVPDGPHDPFLRRVESDLSARLPHYLVPRRWALLDALPLGPTGKVDRAALPEATVPAPAAVMPDPAPAQQATAQPPTRERLRAVWAELLRVPKTHVVDDTSFFSLGGDSISALRLLNRVQEVFGVDYAMVDFFRAPTFGDMAARLAGSDGAGQGTTRDGGDGAAGDRPVELRVPAGTHQRMMYEAASSKAVPETFNISMRVTLTGRLDPRALEAAFTRLVARHHALRCRFTEEDGTTWLEVLAPRPVRLPSEDLRDLAPERRAARVAEVCEAAAWTRFDLGRSTEPVLRLMRTGEQEWVLMAVLHHVSVDGWALTVVLRELGELYRAEVTGDDPALPEPAMQCSDCAAWEREHEESPAEFERKLAFWARQLAGVDDTPPLTTDHPRPKELSGRGRTARLTVGGELPALLAECARRCGATPAAVATAAFALLLRRLSGRADCLIATSNANRPTRELESLVSTTSVLSAQRVRTDTAETFRELVGHVLLTSTKVADHLLPYRVAAEELRRRDGLRLPRTPHVGMMYQNSVDLTLDLPEVEAVIDDQEVESTRRDVTFGIIPFEDRLHLYAEYAVELWREETVRGWLNAYRAVLTAACREPDATLRSLLDCPLDT